MTDALMREIERVIFEAHPLSDRDGAVDFEELLEMRATRFREARDREEDALADLSEQISTELEKDKLVAGLKKQIEEKVKANRRVHEGPVEAGREGQRSEGSAAGRTRRSGGESSGNLRYFAAREQSLLSLKDEVSNLRSYQAPEALRRMQERHKASYLKPEEWTPFLLDYKGDVDTSLTTHLASARKGAKDWKGTPPAQVTDSKVALIADDAELDRLPLALLEAEIARLEKLVSVDRDTANKFSALSKRITDESAALDRLREKLADCEGAKERVKTLVQEREAAYVRVFEAILAEQAVLTELYSPLMTRLSAADGTLKKLSFSVTRDADVARWAAEGERLLDLRRKGPFKGRGTLRQLAEAALKTTWETGDPQTVSAAIATFRSENQEALLERAPVPKADQADYRDVVEEFREVALWYRTHRNPIQHRLRRC